MIVLIGGNGFIGRHVCTMLRSRGDSALVISRQKSGVLDPVPGITYESLDQWRAGNWRDTIREAKAIVYMASFSVPGTFVTEPWRELPNNVEPATQFFVECGRINPACKIVLISSGGTIYGRVTTAKVTEDVATAPISAYGLGKYMIEEALRFSARASGQSFNILRISNPVGMYQTSNAQGIVPIALRSVRDGVPLRIFGDGSAIRDYVDADDVAEAILSSCADEAHTSDIWNVGSGTGLSILDIIALVQEVSGRRLATKFEAARAIDVPAIVLDSTRIRDALGWTARRPLRTSCVAVWRHLGGTVDEAR